MQSKHSGENLVRRSRSLERTHAKVISICRPRSLDSQKQHEIRLMSALYTTDKLGRSRVNWPRSGTLYVYNRASAFQSSTLEAHANDLFKILSNEAVREDKGAAFIIADGGPDWSVKSQHVLISHGRLWRDLDFDYYTVLNYAPGDSRLNPIEHKWAPLSALLTSVTLPITIPGEDLPPCMQSNLSSE